MKKLLLILFASISFVHAQTLHRIIGFGTAGDEQAESTTGASYVTSPVKSGTYALSLLFGGSNYEIAPFKIVADAGDNQGVSFNFRTDDARPITNIDFFETREGANVIWKLSYSPTGKIIVAYDSGTPDTGTFTIPTNSWTRICIMWQHLASGDFDLYINCISDISNTSKDMSGGGTFDTHDLINDGLGIHFFDDFYCKSNTSSVNDFYGNFKVIYKQNSVNNSTDIGDALDAGVWLDAGETPLNESNEIIYQDNEDEGAVNLDSHSSEVDGDANIKGVEYIWRLKMQAGGSGMYVRYGNSGDGLTDSAITLTTSYANYFRLSEGVEVPTQAETIQQGMGATNKDIYCADMWSVVGHVHSEEGEVIDGDEEGNTQIF